MRSSAYRNYLLGVLTIILLFNYVDRLALGVLLEDIKRDLQLSDTELGLLSGIAFALFYSIMGVPIARWADRGNRVLVISLAAVLWSVMVALCGFAGSFVQLLLIRVCVGVGEAGCMPPALSLIGDYFTRAERPRAAAIYAMGGPLSFVLGYFLAGWLNEAYGWRVTFMFLGTPGVILAAVAWFTLREPRKFRAAGQAVALPVPNATVQPSLRQVWKTLWQTPTFRHLLLCHANMSFFTYGVLQWLPTFFLRSFGLSTGATGTWLALTLGTGGVIGTYLGGTLASRYALNNERLQLRALACTITGAGVVSVFIYSSPTPHLAFGLSAFFALGLTTTDGPMSATIQTLVPERMRAVAFALIYLVANFVGLGLGPLAAGALSDAFRDVAGDESLRYALLVLTPGYVLAAWQARSASNTVARDLEKADRAAVQQDEVAGATIAAVQIR